MTSLFGLVLTMPLCVLLMMAISTSCATPLDDYVNAPDSHYTYTPITHFRAPSQNPSATVWVLNMTSQKWLDERFSSRPIWWHYLSIIVPDTLDKVDAGFLFISGGSNTDDPPTENNADLDQLLPVAMTSKTIVSILGQIPNQPTVFKKDAAQRPRYEDDQIAFTWRTFLESGSNPDPTVLLRLPMTKAAVRAMDTVSDFCLKNLNKKISRYVVGGFSKRGWITWTTAAVDKRVVGFVPIVMDLLNLNKNVHHAYRLLGGWTYMFTDYYRENLTNNIDTDNFARMAAVIDPIVYNDRYASKPKCVISASGDSFFPPDGAHYYYDELKGPKYLRMVPNDDHWLEKHQKSVYEGMTAFYVEVISGAKLPSVKWELSQTNTSGGITVWTDRKPTSIIAYHANTVGKERRDFRLTKLDPSKTKVIPQDVEWFTQPVSRINDTMYQATVSIPKSGWAAFYIQVTFDSSSWQPMTFTTAVNVIPDTFPFKDCHGTGCYGTLV